MDLVVTDDANGAAQVAADRIARWLAAALASRGSASLAVSGGTTPAMMLAALGRHPLDWTSVHVWQVDERVAPDGDPARNSALLALLAVPPRNVHPMPVTAADLAAAARRYARSLPTRLDVVHLGLGDDGHTASWPPGDPVIDEVEPVALSGEYRGHRRMTLTPPVVNGARHRLVLAAGAAKAAPLAGWLLGADLPIGRVHRTATVVVLDAAAAASLPGGSRQ